MSEAHLESGDELRRLAADARLIEAAIPRERISGLPACRGRARLSVILEGLLRGGEQSLDEDRLLTALDGQLLTLRELWSVPVALRIAVAEALERVAQAIVQSERDRACAESWVSHPRGRCRLSPDFIEHALRRCGEEGLPHARERLETRLRQCGVSADLAIRQAHDARAHLRLRLDNLSGILRLMERLDWQTCFEALSEVDAELRRDPAGLYPLMDDESRRLILEQVSAVARACGLGERTVARYAVSAARQRMGRAPAVSARLPDLEDIDPETSCCWWLYDDGGRDALLRHMNRPRARLPRRVPDPHGYGCIAVHAALTLGLALGLWRWLQMPWLVPACVPAAWCAADALMERVFPHLARPARLLKLDFDRLPDSWRTLIVTPVLLSDLAHADSACDRLEALGCLEKDPNIACLLLGDFADADDAHMPGDDAIVKRVRDRIAEMNRRAGREKYYCLHRPRTFNASDRRYMGRDRKRGALLDLNRVLLGGVSDFSVEGAACAALQNRFRYVVTLDADTRMLPGTVHRLVGALAHPMNRRYAVLQPRMEVSPSSVNSRFALMLFGAGGLDTYPTQVSSLWMDLTGTGIYGGKGIYRVADFQRAVEGRLPEGRVLSHDLIEGALAGAGSLNDVVLYDGCPATLSGWMTRQHRWTRGDWQLLPLIFSKECRLQPVDRHRMLDNLMRSLRAPALWLMLMASAWSGRMEGIAAGMLLIFLNGLMHPLKTENWHRALIELALLPQTAHRMADAALRALWRVLVSGRHLMDWVPSADAERGGSVSPAPGRIAALLTLPGLLAPDSIPCVLALFMLFWVGGGWVRGMEDQPLDDAPALTGPQRSMLMDLARDTWRFFSENMSPEGPALPPDNVQLDPPVGAARRTSPTNIGLYLLSCVSARQLGFIDGADCDGRIARALDAVDRCDKWRGHLYNWIDIDALEPLRPRYVSAVDSGNLAACALACARLTPDEALAARLERLAERMDFSALYDRERHLFFIGMDVDAGMPSASHYDLLASESRILSYTALMLGQIPLKHWARLGRSCTNPGGGAALLSWSGTIFEYLMPEILMRAPALSLLGGSVRSAVQAQMDRGAPWGVSESGYHAFDAQMNYQYRAFGLKALAMNGDAASDGVIAPYASALALAVQPGPAAENLRHMTALGWRDSQGFFEAADARHPDADGMPALVRSHMAHHQGMTLCAICNALTGDSLAKGFMGDARARALSLLLEERPACASRVRSLPKSARIRPASNSVQRVARHGLDVHLLSGRKAFALVNPEGAVHYARDGFDATRFYGDLADRLFGAALRLRINGVSVTPRYSCRYDAGSARFEAAEGDLRIVMTVSLSPEDDALYRAVEVKNTGARPVRAEVMEVLPVSLARPRDFQAHPAFQLLFVESEPLGEDGLLFRRRPRNPDERCPELIHVAFCRGAVQHESRFERIFDRSGGVRFELSGGTGTPLNPASALKTRLELGPGEAESLCFALRLRDPGDTSTIQYRPDRAAALGRARTEAMLGFLGIAQGYYHRLDRLSALLLDPALAARAKADRSPVPGTPREALWAMGISGDRPILSLAVSDPGHASAAHMLLKAHGFYRAMGLETDLALIDLGPGGYAQPVSDMLKSLTDAAPLQDRAHVFLLCGLSPDRLAVLRRASALFVQSDSDLNVRLSPVLAAPEPRPFCPAYDPEDQPLPPPERFMDNGYGGFTGDGYAIDVRPGRDTPAPWCNIMATDGMGILLTERGGGFIWHGNSRFCRLTGYRGDPARERFGLSLTYETPDGRALSLLPGESPALPYRVRMTPDETAYGFSAGHLSGETVFRISDNAVLIDLSLRLSISGGTVRLGADWLMGAERGDGVWLHTWHTDAALFASGSAPGVGWLVSDSPEAEADGALSVPVRSGENRLRFALGWAPDVPSARSLARASQEGNRPKPHRENNDRLTVQTPDEALNLMMNTFLPHQARAARLDGRTGYYQPGGAYGFRDQLQDMLALIPLEPDRVRRHLLICAGRQFAAGDAMHWWHMPYLGVRTRIRDDRLFLPMVTAEYVKQTGDHGVLDEIVPYLEDTAIPDGREDVFAPMKPGGDAGTLHDHCMRAFRASDATGDHGLALMGAGDWNDGMNRVGHLGRGESIWLSEFIAYCADSYANICPDAADAEWLRDMARRHRGAVELYGWDGQWYLRAYADSGAVLGSAQNDACRIDLITQAWAALTGLSPDRVRTAMDSAWRALADEDAGIIRLLTPPFGAGSVDPGYIRGYPGGVRENGAQYTHAACWMMLAWIRLGDADHAHRSLQMLLPPNHADTPEKADQYRVEPYVMAADICDLPGEKGRGGWTWYTGSAAWLYVAVLALLGYERRGSRVRLNALLGPWPRVSITVKHGKGRTRLVCDRNFDGVTLDGVSVGDAYIELVDDDQDHEAHFPPRD